MTKSKNDGPLRHRALALLLATLWLAPAHAADSVRVGLASPSFIFGPFYVGQSQGIFARAGLDIQPTEFSGAAKLHQAMVAGVDDIALGGGTDFAFIAKGAAELGVASLVDKPVNFAFMVANASGIKTPADLKGGRIGISGNGTLTFWLARRLAAVQGWGPDSYTPVAAGAVRSGQMAALLTGQIDTVISDPALGYQLEQDGRGRILLFASDFVPDFITNATFASTDFARAHPAALRRFLAAYLQATDWMLAHPAESTAVGAKLTGLDPSVIAREFEAWRPMWSRTGHFRADLLALMQDALVEAEMLPARVDLAPMIDESFLPATVR